MSFHFFFCHRVLITGPVILLEIILDFLPVHGEPLHHLVGVDGVSDHAVGELLLVVKVLLLGHQHIEFLQAGKICYQ